VPWKAYKLTMLQCNAEPVVNAMDVNLKRVILTGPEAVWLGYDSGTM